MATLVPIPFPPTVPFLGNVMLMDKEMPLRTFTLLAQQYGEIYGFKFPDGSVTLHINSQSLVAQVSDDKRFKKVINNAMQEVRNLVGDGLFSAYIDEPAWGIAHRILMPAFSSGNVLHMFDDMKDICDQLLTKWERFGPDNIFDPSEDYTRLTFDTIALCSMSHRFNSFYDASLPKFTQEMVDVLIESTKRAYRTPFAKALPLINKSVDERYFAAIKDMSDTARKIVADRKSHPIDKKDLLTLMLDGRDQKTGERISDESIVFNLITFLVAGHETTSGMLTFSTYYLLKNPEALCKLRKEIDSVVGDEEIRLEHLSKLPYLIAVMRETLRLAPTASSRTCTAFEDTILVGGDGDPTNSTNKKFEVKKDVMITVHGFQAMRDPRVWGEDAEQFKPERMLDGKFEKLPFQAWQPFGYGIRACIGRPFAWQEAQLVLASIFAKFDVFFADPGYTLQIKQALTIKPKNLHIRVAPRKHLNGSIPRRLPSPAVPAGTTAPAAVVDGNRPVYVFYGSNTGTSEGFAGRIASDASAHGFKANLCTLDTVTANVPTDGPVVIVTASFEGEPADNAGQFVGWLQNLSEDNKHLKGVKYAVFGCGNREWVRTYQRIPTLIDELFEKNGAERFLGRGEADAGSIDFFQAFDEYETKIWEAMDKVYGIKEHALVTPAQTETLSVKIVDAGTARSKLLRQPDAAMGKVLENRLLTKPGAPEKRHIKIELPEGMAYKAGDYLAILPTNPHETVRRALSLFGLSGEQEVVIKSEGPTSFPVDSPTPVHHIISGFVELTQPATTRDLETILMFAKSDESTALISELKDHYQEKVISKRLSVLDILEQHRDISISFATFLRLLPAMRVRQYSISSSPLVNPQHATLTVSVLSSPALSGSGAQYLGVASNFLASLKPGDVLPVAVRQSNVAFHLPTDPTVPVIMFCAGSGLAPFRGFVEERAAQKQAGRKVGEMLLFFGCRSQGEDYLYADSELGEWARGGVVEVRPAFSRDAVCSEGCKYVQDRIWLDREEVTKLFHENAKFYTCGSRKVSNGIKKACIDMIKASRNISEGEATEQFDKVQKERYATDVFD